MRINSETNMPLNVTPVLDELAMAVTELDTIAEERATLDAQTKAVYERLQAEHGCNRQAIKAAIRYAKLDEAKRMNWDWTYAQTRSALGLPVQPDLFDEALAEAITSETKDKMKTH